MYYFRHEIRVIKPRIKMCHYMYMRCPIISYSDYYVRAKGVVGVQYIGFGLVLSSALPDNNRSHSLLHVPSNKIIQTTQNTQCRIDSDKGK